MSSLNRKLPRLTGFDYSGENSYFVTICTKDMKCLFGTVDALNSYGKIAENELLKITTRFKDIHLDKYIIMPNHIHAIITIGHNRVIRDLEAHDNLSVCNVLGYEQKELVWCKRLEHPYDVIKRSAECGLWQKYPKQSAIAVRYPFVRS